MVKFQETEYYVRVTPGMIATKMITSIATLYRLLSLKIALGGLGFLDNSGNSSHVMVLTRLYEGLEIFQWSQSKWKSTNWVESFRRVEE